MARNCRHPIFSTIIAIVSFALATCLPIAVAGERATAPGGYDLSTGGSFLSPVTSPILIGAGLTLAGRGFTAGSMLNFFVSTASGAGE